MTNRPYLPFFLLNPFLALVLAIRNFRTSSFTYVLMLFCAFYGSSQMFGEDGQRYKDNSAYRDKLYQMHDQEASWESFSSSLLDGKTTFDLAIPIVTYLTASVTREKKVLFFIFGLIFGYFYSKNIQFLLGSLSADRLDRFLVFLVLVFALVVPFWSGLNTVRMWTGAHVFFFGASRLVKYGKLKSLVYVFLAVFFHFSYIAVAGIVLLFYFTPLKQYNTIFLIGFVLTFVLAQANVELIASTVRSYSPALYSAKTEQYTKDAYVETFKDKRESYSWHANAFGPALKFAMVYLILITYLLNAKTGLLPAGQRVLLSFALMLFSFANLIAQLPSGARFYSIAYLFALVPISHYYSKAPRKWPFFLALIPMLFWMVVHIRDGFDHLTLATFLSNPLTIWFDFLNQDPLIEYIK